MLADFNSQIIAYGMLVPLKRATQTAEALSKHDTKSVRENKLI